MKILRRWLVLTAILIGTAPGSALATVPPNPLVPKATIVRSTWEIGNKMTVNGDGWTSGRAIVRICGNAAVNGTVDCDLIGSRSFGVSENHSFVGNIIVGAPPPPCPCVVMVASEHETEVVLIPITLKDHPVQEGVPSPAPPEGLTSLGLSTTITKGPWWRDAVGVSPDRTISVTIRNTGKYPSGDGVLDITVGKSSPATGFAASIPFDSLEAGKSTTVAATFELDTFAYGTYNITARVTSPAAGAETTVQTSTFPGWLLGAIIALILIADLFWVRHVRKRKRESEEAELAAIAAAEAAQFALDHPELEQEPGFGDPSTNGDGEHRYRDDEAAAVADYLVSVGVDAAIIDTVRAGGYRKPADTAPSSAAWEPASPVEPADSADTADTAE